MSKKKAYAQAMQALAHVYDFLGEHCTRFFYNRDFEYSVAKAGDNTTYMIDKAYRAVYIVHDDVDADKDGYGNVRADATAEHFFNGRGVSHRFTRKLCA